MPQYEYKVVPAPKKPGKIRGVKGTDNRFAHHLTGLMNEYGADGWEYQRTDTLPCEERKGLTGTTTTFQNMLVFRREINLLEEPLMQIEHHAEPEPAPAAPPASIPMPTFSSRAAAEKVPEPVAAPPAPEPVQTPEIAAEIPAEPAPEPASAPAPMAVPTFRSAAISPGPKLAAPSDIPEGKAPPIAAQ